MGVEILFTNNATSRLVAATPAGSISIQLPTGEGAKFPQPDVDKVFMATIEDRRTKQLEIVRCIGRTTDIVQVVRGVEGTVAQDFLAGATFSNRMTAGTLDWFMQTAVNNAGYSQAAADAKFVDIAGDTMTGHLALPTGPAAANAVRKDYVDAADAALAAAITAGGIGDAPVDSKYYARRNAAWAEIPSAMTDAPADGTAYGRSDAAWLRVVKLTDFTAFSNSIDARVDVVEADIATLQTDVSDNTADIATNAAAINTKIGEAPMDGNQYARRSGGWTVVVGGGGGGGIAEAPSDSKLYGRYNATWVESVTKAGIDAADALRVLKAGDVMTGNLTISKANSTLILNKPNAGSSGLIYGQTNNVQRWVVYVGDATAESGANSGSNFVINAYDDTGAFSSQPLTINRATGVVALRVGSTVNGVAIATVGHTHTASQVTDFSEAVDDRVAAMLVAGANVTLTYNDVANTMTIASTGGGGGGITDAPTNGEIYGRKDAAWALALPQMLVNPVSPTINGQLVIEATHNGYLTFKYRGSDGVVRIFEMPMVPPLGTPPPAPSGDFSDPANTMYLPAILEDF